MYTGYDILSHIYWISSLHMFKLHHNHPERATLQVAQRSDCLPDFVYTYEAQALKRQHQFG